jgi:phosphonate transport system ATP-binding protein
MTAAIEVRDVSVVFAGRVRAIDAVTLDFRGGELAVLLGRSGAGKSTLLRCLNRLVAPTAGSVVVPGLGDLADPEVCLEHRRRTGMIFQHHHLLGCRTALDNVLMGRLGRHGPLRSLFPLPRRDVRFALECLDRVGLAGLALRRADRLSGGERQRVGVARALAQEPRMLLADEPVASLDPVTAHELLGEIRRICREDGLTAVISLHQLEYARDFGERIVGLRGGRTAFDGAPDGLGNGGLKGIYEVTDAPGSDACPPPDADQVARGKGVRHETGADDRRRDVPPRGLRQGGSGEGRRGPGAAEGHRPARRERLQGHPGQ